MRYLLILAFCVILGGSQAAPSTSADDTKVTLEHVNKSIHELKYIYRVGAYEEFAHFFDMVPSLETMSTMQELGKKYAKIQTEDAELKEALRYFRQILKLFVLDIDQIKSAETSLDELKELITQQNVASFDNSDELISFYPDIYTILTDTDRAEEEIRYYWLEWRDTHADAAKENVKSFYNWMKIAANLSDLSTNELWFTQNNEKLLDQIDDVMDQLKPFYQKIHAYIRHLLFKRFGAGVVKPNGPIPDHLYEHVELTNQNTNSYLEDFEIIDYETVISEEEYTSKKLIQFAENFYTSLGFEPFTEKKWERDILVQYQLDKEICKPQALDIRTNATAVFCAESNIATLLENYRYMGRLHFAQEKKNLSEYQFRSYGLEQGMAEAMKISAKTVNQQKRVGFLKKTSIDVNSADFKLGRNLHTAMDTILKLFREFVLQKLTIKLLDGSLDINAANEYYWKLMEEYVGVEPAADRFENSFDPPIAYYANLNTDSDLSLRFVPEVLGFQYYKALCQKINHIGQLDLCDFYDHKEVGELLKKTVSLGSTKSLDEVMTVILPEPKLDATAILDYFAPADNWLKEYIKTNNLTLGWTHSTKRLNDRIYSDEEAAKKFIDESSEKIYKLYNEIVNELFAKDVEEDDYYSYGPLWTTSKTGIAIAELKEISLQAQKFHDYKFKDWKTRRAIKHLGKIADIFALDKDYENIKTSNRILHEMPTDVDIEHYKSPENYGRVAFIPDIQNVFINSTDAEELLYYWSEFRKTNEFARHHISSTLKALEKAAEILGVSVTNIWFKHFNSNIITRMEEVIKQLEPLYEQLHAFIRYELYTKYGEDVLRSDGPIPDHLYQQVFLQTWTNYSIFEPLFEDDPLPPVDTFIAEHKYDALKLLSEADKFYQSLGLEALEEVFWKEHLKPQAESENNTACHGTVYDMIPQPYMKYCEEVNYKKFLQAHSDLGRVHYAHEKRNLPAYFFKSYDLEYPLGEAIVLSASSQKHMQTIGLAGDFEFTDSMLLNRLLRMGMHTLINVHKYYVHSKVINELLEKEIEESDMERYYWELMLTYVGVEPPKDRKSDQFDFPYDFYTDLEQNHMLKKFISEIMGYGFYNALCGIAEHEGDLNNCDFFGNKEVGKKMQEMMQLGSLKSYFRTVNVIIPDIHHVNGDAIMKYYEPMYDWLKHRNEIVFAEIGYGTTNKKYLKAEYIYDGEKEAKENEDEEYSDYL